jgi:AcrR family transcriptional regulator
MTAVTETCKGRSRKNTRERILEAAMELFAESGFSGTTISEVERRVGLAVGTGSLYRHFASKEELLQAALEREIMHIRLDVQRRAEEAEDSTDDPAERRLRAYRQRLHDMRRADRLFRLMLNEGDRVPELREAVWTALRVRVKTRPAHLHERQRGEGAGLHGLAADLLHPEAHRNDLGVHRVRTGDLILTGTPSGVGHRRTPPLYLKSGDVVSVEVTGVGALRNTIA